MIFSAIAAKMDSAAFWSSVGAVDLIFLVMMLLGMFFGMKKGLAAVLAGLIEVIGAQVVTIEYSASISLFLTTRFQLPFIHIVIFAALAIASILAIRLIFKLLGLIAAIEFKPPVNQLIGTLAGALQFVLFLALVFEFMMLFQVPYIQEAITKKSMSGPYLIEISEQVHYFFERWIP